MIEQKKEFTGVWIPRHIIEDQDLSMTDRMIYAEIACFEVCYKSNEKLGERYGLKGGTISGVISKLVKKEYIEFLGVKEGRYRQLVAKKDKPKPNRIQPTEKIVDTLREKSYTVSDKNHTIDNNKENKKEEYINSTMNSGEPLSFSENKYLDYPEEFDDSEFDEYNKKIISSKKENKPIQFLKQQEFNNSINLITHLEQHLGRKMPEAIITVPTKNGITEVDLNRMSAKRLNKRYGLENVKKFIDIFFRERKKQPEEEKKYLPSVGNMVSFETKLVKILQFIENIGINPFTDERYKKDTFKKVETKSMRDEFNEFMAKKKKEEKK